MWKREREIEWQNSHRSDLSGEKNNRLTYKKGDVFSRRRRFPSPREEAGERGRLEKSEGSADNDRTTSPFVRFLRPCYHPRTTREKSNYSERVEYEREERNRY
jgi:hypothetical protein